MGDDKDKSALLQKYLKDPTKKIIWKDIKNRDYQRYKFLVSTTDYPDEVRYSEAFFVGDGKTFTMSRSTSKSQKFICVGGPLAGQKVIVENAKDYVLFNRSSSRGKEDTSVPSAILVYRQSVEP